RCFCFPLRRSSSSTFLPYTTLFRSWLGMHGCALSDAGWSEWQNANTGCRTVLAWLARTVPSALFGNGRSMVKKPTDDETLQQAAALEAASPDKAGALYADILRRDRGNLEASNALERLGHAESFGRWMRVDCTIHPQDDIFRFIRSAPETRDPIRAYLADGWRTLSEPMVRVERVDRPLLKMDNV